MVTRLGGKRSRATTKIREVSEDMEDVDDDGDGSAMEDLEEDPSPAPTNRRTKKPETEEEKRRNFLERNRQGPSLPFLSSFLKLISILKLLLNVGSAKRLGLHHCRQKSNISSKKTNV